MSKLQRLTSSRTRETRHALSAVGVLAVCLAATLPSVAHAVPLLSNLVAWWNAEGNANDIQGLNNGTLGGGVAYAPGRIGKAFAFDGVTGELNVLKTLDLNMLANDFSVEAWIKIPSGPLPPPPLYGKSYAIFFNYAGVPAYGLTMTVSDHKPHFGFRPGNYNTPGEPPNPTASGTSSLNDGRWHHLVGRRTATTASIFVDGVLQGSVTNAAVMTVNGGSIDTSVCQYARIGSVHSGPGNCSSATSNPQEGHFPGLIDEVRVYKRALTDSEILLLSKWAGP